MQRNQQAEGVSEDDVNEIKQDISAFRYELLEILKNNDMKVQPTKAGEWNILLQILWLIRYEMGVWRQA